jgi:hypothetical protein
LNCICKNEKIEYANAKKREKANGKRAHFFSSPTYAKNGKINRPPPGQAAFKQSIKSQGE